MLYHSPKNSTRVRYVNYVMLFGPETALKKHPRGINYVCAVHCTAIKSCGGLFSEPEMWVGLGWLGVHGFLVLFSNF